jgi:hypothetical protein
MATNKNQHTKKADTPAAKTAHNKAALLKALKEARGIVTTACDAVGVNRSTYYDYYNSDPEFKREADDVQEIAIDFVEGKLFEQIEEGIPTSTLFYLKTKAKHRGYIERTEVSHTGSIPVAAKISDEAKDKINEALEGEY